MDNSYAISKDRPETVFGLFPSKSSFLFMFPYWNDSKNEEIYTDSVNSLHGWVEFFGILEIFVKFAMIFIVITFYKNYGPISGLFNFKYS